MSLSVDPSVCLSVWLTAWLNVCLSTHLSDNIHTKLSFFVSNLLLGHQYIVLTLSSLHMYPMHFLFYAFLDFPVFHCNCRSAFPPCESCRIAPRLFRWLILLCSAFVFAFILHSFSVLKSSVRTTFDLKSWKPKSQPLVREDKALFLIHQWLIYVCLCVYVYGCVCVWVCIYIQVHTHQWWIKRERRRVWFSPPPHPPKVKRLWKLGKMAI